MLVDTRQAFTRGYSTLQAGFEVGGVEQRWQPSWGDACSRIFKQDGKMQSAEACAVSKPQLSRKDSLFKTG